MYMSLSWTTYLMYCIIIQWFIYRYRADYLSRSIFTNTQSPKCLHYNPVQPLSTIDLIIWPLTLDSIHGFSFWQVNTTDLQVHSHSCQNSGKDLDPGHWLTTDTCHIASSLQDAICHFWVILDMRSWLLWKEVGPIVMVPYVEMSENHKINLMTFCENQSKVRAVWTSKGNKHLKATCVNEHIW